MYLKLSYVNEHTSLSSYAKVSFNFSNVSINTDMMRNLISRECFAVKVNTQMICDWEYYNFITIDIYHRYTYYKTQYVRNRTYFYVRAIYPKCDVLYIRCIVRRTEKIY